MKIRSWNVNGIRAVYKKGFLDWFEEQGADIVCVQETKAQPDQLDEEALHPLGYHSYFCSAEKKGYSGVAVFSKKEPLGITEGLGIEEFDSEGRSIFMEYKDFTLINTYFPNSQREHARLDYKLRFCDAILERCQALHGQGKNVILCGDYNIAHKPIDLRNPKTNEKNAGYLPEEREWMSKYLEAGFVDIFRHFEKGPDFYTWWSYRPGVRQGNIGWRIDYFTSNPEFLERIKDAPHQPQVMGSDHCPLELNLR